MTIDIELKLGYGRLAVREPFLIAADTPVVLAFKSDYALKDTMVKFSADDGSSCSLRLKNLSEIEVPTKLVKAGTLSLEVVLIVKEKAVKRWAVEPIVFSEEGTGFSGHPEFEEILERLNTVENVVASNTASVSTLTAKATTFEQNIADIYSAIEQ